MPETMNPCNGVGVKPTKVKNHSEKKEASLLQNFWKTTA